MTEPDDYQRAVAHLEEYVLERVAAGDMPQAVADAILARVGGLLRLLAAEMNATTERVNQNVAEAAEALEETFVPLLGQLETALSAVEDEPRRRFDAGAIDAAASNPN